MTIYELQIILDQLPQDAEIIINHGTKYTHSVLNDKNTIDRIEYDEDETPIVYLNTEF